MFLAYDGIVFDVLLLNSWDQNAILSDDGVDFLYWHHIIDVTCILNPQIVAGNIMPPQADAGLNQVLKQKIDADDQLKRNQTNAAKSGKVLPANNSEALGGSPIKSSITLAGLVVPTGSAPVPTQESLFYDDAGNPSEMAVAGTPAFPPVTEMLPGSGVLFDDDLAAKTAPVNESLAGNWSNQVAAEAAPAVLDETTTQYADNPQLQFVVNSVSPNLAIIGGLLPEQPRPDPPVPQPGPRDFPFNAPPNAKRQRFPGNSNLPASDTELRDRLQVPRRKLVVWLNTGPNAAPEFILSLPYDGCTTDAVTGPRCIDQNMTAIHGNVTGVKRLVFEAHEALPLFFGERHSLRRVQQPSAERPSNAGVPLVQPNNQIVLTPPIVSNRWTMKQMPDQTTFLNTTVITGKAVFRMDVLSRMQITPDQLRKYIMPPIATGYVRRPPEVSLSSNGCEVEYTIVDDQQMMDNPAGQRWGVHSVAVTASFNMNNPAEWTIANFRQERK